MSKSRISSRFQQPVVAGGARAALVVFADQLGPEHPHHELIDGRKLLHELPWVLALAQALPDDRLQLVVRLGGAMMIVVGLLLVTGWWERIVQYLQLQAVGWVPV